MRLFEIRAQRKADRRDHGIGPAIGTLEHHVARLFDEIGIVAGITEHEVGVAVSGQGVVTLSAIEQVIAGSRRAACRCRSRRTACHCRPPPSRSSPRSAETTIGRQAEYLAVEIDDVEVAERILAERRRRR